MPSGSGHPGRRAFLAGKMPEPPDVPLLWQPHPHRVHGFQDANGKNANVFSCHTPAVIIPDPRKRVCQFFWRGAVFRRHSPRFFNAKATSGNPTWPDARFIGRPAQNDPSGNLEQMPESGYNAAGKLV